MQPLNVSGLLSPRQNITHLSLAAAKANDDYSQYSRIDKISASKAEITHQLGIGNGLVANG
jgi:hypothetical protein